MRFTRHEAGLLIFLLIFVGFLVLKIAQPFAEHQAKGALIGAGYIDPVVSSTTPTDACPAHNFRYFVLKPNFETGTICAGSLTTPAVISPGIRMKGIVS